MEEKAGGLAIDAEGGVRGIAYLDGLALGVDELALVAETAPATVAERAADFSLRHDGRWMLGQIGPGIRKVRSPK